MGMDATLRMSNKNASSGPSSSSGNANQFKRYSLVDLFDEQYGHLQRNELIDNQKNEEKKIGMSMTTQNKQTSSALSVFIVSDQWLPLENGFNLIQRFIGFGFYNN